jgi:hypothetical protein
MRWVGGGPVSLSTGSPGWVTCRVPAAPGRSPTSRSPRWSPGRWSPLRRTRRTGRPGTWPRRRPGDGPVAVVRVADLAGVRPAATPDRDVQGAARSVVVDTVHDVVGLHLDPPERALVFCPENPRMCVPRCRRAPGRDVGRGVVPSAPPSTSHAGQGRRRSTSRHRLAGGVHSLRRWAPCRRARTRRHGRARDPDRPGDDADGVGKGNVDHSHGLPPLSALLSPSPRRR